MFRLAVGAVAVAGVIAAAGGSDIPLPRAVDVAGIVKQLGSEDFAEREAAARRLATLNVDEVPPELLAALKSESPEVRNRAAKAVRELREHIVLMRLPRGDRFAKRGQIDLYVASTALSRYKADDDRLWLPAYEAGVRAVTMAEMTGDRKPQGGPTWFADFATYKKAYPGIEFVRSGGLYKKQSGLAAEAIRASGFESIGLVNCLLVSRGPVTAGIMQSLVLATGDISCGHNIFCSVVICDGDVRVKRDISVSLIIARGNITVDRTVEVSTLIAGGTVTIAEPPEPPRKVANPLLQRDIDSRRVVVEEKVTRPLGYITFFELSTVGAEVNVADKAVRVAAVAEGKAFATAGVRVGDVVTGVNGKTPDSAEALRRLLRDALAIGDATLTVRRGAATATVKVSLSE